MNDELYAIVAMAARYWFCGLMILIVARAWRGAAVDRARARTIRACAPQTGCVGTFTVYPGTRHEEAIPIPREGEIGRARKADIRVRERALKPYHAHFEIREDGLLIAPHAGADARLNSRVRGDALLMRDGDTLSVCGVRMKLALYERPAKHEPETWNEDTLWDAASVEKPQAGGDWDEAAIWGGERAKDEKPADSRDGLDRIMSRFASREELQNMFKHPNQGEADWDDEAIWDKPEKPKRKRRR